MMKPELLYSSPISDHRSLICFHAASNWYPHIGINAQEIQFFQRPQQNPRSISFPSSSISFIF